MNETDIDKAAEVLEEARTLVLACHVGPDGDALGSMLAMAIAAAAVNKKVYASFGQPFVLSQSYRFLATELLVQPKDIPKQPEVMVAFDTASLDRLGELAGPATHAGTLIVVDHHITNPGFGHINLVDPTAAASGEICFNLIRRLGWPISPAAATALYTALVTDTGRFQYSNTTPATLRMAAELVDLGARPEVVGQHIYEEEPFGFLRVAATVLGRARLDPNLSLVWSVLHLSDLDNTGVGQADIDSLIDLVRLPREAQVAALIKEHGDNTVKVSMRSRGVVDVGAVALALGGGGHHNAAGFTFTGSAEQALAGLRLALANG
jgi:phosphoesterase RecJ-like protein